jgi:hypothetical protein
MAKAARRQGSWWWSDDFDVTGKKVYSQPFTTETTQFALILKDLPAGLFEVRLLNSSGDVLEMSRLIKE